MPEKSIARSTARYMPRRNSESALKSERRELTRNEEHMEYLIIIAFAVLAYEYFYGGMR